MQIGDAVTVIGDMVGIVVAVCVTLEYVQVMWPDGVASWEMIDDLEVL